MAREQWVQDFTCSWSTAGRLNIKGFREETPLCVRLYLRSIRPEDWDLALQLITTNEGHSFTDGIGVTFPEDSEEYEYSLEYSGGSEEEDDNSKGPISVDEVEFFAGRLSKCRLRKTDFLHVVESCLSERRELGLEPLKAEDRFREYASGGRVGAEWKSTATVSAGAGPQVRKLVCFVETDASFCVPLDAIDELGSAGRLKNVGKVTVGNDGLRHAKTENIYRSEYDFSRTLGVVLRAFMLTATGLIKYYDPDEKSKKKSETVAANLTEGKNGYFIEPRDPSLHLIPDDDPKGTAKEISGNFDRLYPHILIEKKLEDAEFEEVHFPRRMVIVDLKNPDDPRVNKLHKIDVAVKFKKHKGKVIKCPKPSVKYTIEDVLDGVDGPKFEQFKDMIRRYRDIVPREREKAVDLVAQLGEKFGQFKV